MKDRVGEHIPTPEEYGEIQALLDQLEQKLARYLLSLSPEERVSALKMRKGGENVAETVGRMAEKHGAQLNDASREGIENDLKLVEILTPIAERLIALQLKVDDTITEARSEAWWATTALYTILSRLASGNPELAAALKPIAEFFGRGRKRNTTPTK